MVPPPVARTPLHAWHAERGARFADSGGWLVPAAYAGAEQEAAAARSGVGLADVSALGKLSALGRGVAGCVSSLAGDGRAARPGGVARFAEGLACRLRADHLLLVGTTTGTAALEARLAGQPLVLSDATSAYAGFCLTGPRVEEVLRHLTAVEVLPGACAETALAGVHALLVGPPHSALPVRYVLVGWDLGEFVWERLLHAGRGYGMTVVGAEGLLRVL
jgi:aminomethyltransferase